MSRFTVRPSGSVRSVPARGSATLAGIPPWAVAHTFLQVDLAEGESFTREFLRELQSGQGTSLARATTNDLYLALARTSGGT